MEKEISDLKKQLARSRGPASTNNVPARNNGYASNVTLDQWNGSHEAVAGLLDLRSGVDSSTGLARSPGGQLATSKRIEDVVITNDRVTELFQRRVQVKDIGERLLIHAFQILHFLSSILSIPQSRQVTRSLLLINIASPVLACRQRWCSKLPSRQNTLHCSDRTGDETRLEYSIGSTSQLPRRESAGIAMHVVISDLKHNHGPNIHTVWCDDANRYANWSSPTKSCPRLHKVQNRAERS